MPANLTLAREIAYDVFVEVMEQKKRPEAVMDAYYKLHTKNLKRLDRNLVKEIVYGGLRWYAKILWILQNTSSRDLKSVSPQVRAALVLGTYQIFYLDRVPDRAAVNESVEYIRKKGQASAVSFVNGILRQIARRAEYFAKPDKTNQAADYLALQFSFPKWMVERWLEYFKFDRMETMLASMNQPPPNSVRVNTMKVPQEEMHLFQQQLLRDERTHTEKRSLRCCLRFKEAPNVDEGSLFAQGYYTIQDEAAQLIAFLVEPKEGETIVDAAAGPGGKLSHLFELAAGKAQLIAVEKSKIKMMMAQETLKRLGHEGITWEEADFLEWKPSTKVDKILLDVPCSGLGVLRRHPEGKWHKDPTLIPTMAEQQKRFIKHALGCLKKGGELIYSVCSFEKEETDAQLAWLLTEFKGQVSVISPVTRVPDYFKRYVTRDNVLAIYAGNQDDMDGFGAFVVRVDQEL